MSRCAECVECWSDHCFNSAYCLADPVGSTRPCPHDLPLCEAHLDECPDCVRYMEENLAAAFDHARGDLLPPARILADLLAEQAAWLAARKAATGYDPATGTYTRPNTNGGPSYG